MCVRFIHVYLFMQQQQQNDADAIRRQAFAGNSISWLTISSVASVGRGQLNRITANGRPQRRIPTNQPTNQPTTRLPLRLIVVSTAPVSRCGNSTTFLSTVAPPRRLLSDYRMLQCGAHCQPTNHPAVSALHDTTFCTLHRTTYGRHSAKTVPRSNCGRVTTTTESSTNTCA